MATSASPIQSPLSSPSSPTLFSTDIANNVIELKNVILNEFHILQRFLLISECEQALRVTLDSDLHTQIGFQLNNENVDSTDGRAGADSSVTTFLADDFCELFNTVNLVSEVILQPRQIQQVIIAFRPLELSEDVPHRAREIENGQQSNRLSSDQKQSKSGAVESSHQNVDSRAIQSFKVNGRLFLSAAVLADETQTLQSSVTKKIMDPCQDMVVHFYSTVCRCTLRAEVSEIVFDDCVPGGVFVKDFSVWNLSEIPCGFHIHAINGNNDQPTLDLTDYDTELPLSNGELKSCAHRRIRVIYKPRDVGDFSYSIHLENCFDVQNSTCIPVHCMVNAEHRQEGLLVTGVGEDGVLDYGDCYANNGTCQMLTLRNITQEALEVNLVTDHSAGDQVNFYLETELEIPNTNANGFSSFIKPGQDASSTPEDESSQGRLSQNLGTALGTSVNVDKKSRVEELSLERGEEKNLLVWFYPAGASDEAKAARLQRHTFRVSLQCVEKKGRSRQRFSNIIQCKAQACTSIAKLSTAELNFGDCNIGSGKSAAYEIINLSDLPALVTSGVSSTILSFKNKAERVLIPPRQSYSIEVDLVPLKINPKYRKQITIENVYNKDNQQVLEVRAKIMDRHHVLLHSLYYKLRTPSTNNILTFDCVVVNNPSVRTLGVENITDKCLTLGFETSMPGELGIYQLRDDFHSDIGDDTDSLFSECSEDDEHETRKRAYAASVNKEKLLETLEESQPRLSKAIVESAPFPVQQGQKKSIQGRPPSTPVQKKTRMRMSLDMATMSFPNGGDNTSGPRSSVGRPDSVDGDAKEFLSNVKPFNVTADKPARRTLKRVQSSALLHPAKESPGAAFDSSQDKVSRENIEEVLQRLGNLVISQCLFPDEESEKKYVDNQIKDRELLVHFLEDHSRRLISVRKLELNPGETKLLYVMLRVDPQTQPSLHGRLQRMTAKVSIRLLEYDKDQLLDLGTLEHPSEDDLLTREVPVHFKACKALLFLAQRNISFGKLLTNEHRAKTLVLRNISEVPLLYKLKKTGSIASGDLHIINGRSGVLRPNTDREVNFVFQPSLGGSFHEKLIVGNVHDPANDQVVTLKAFINRADTFWLNTSSMDFGTVTVGEWSKPQDIVILNNSKQARTYVLKAIDHAVEDRPSKSTNETTLFRFTLEEKKKQSPQWPVAPEQEAIEALERKGIAFERKGKADKAAKVRSQINQLKEKIGSLTKLETLPANTSSADMNPSISLASFQSNHAREPTDGDADQQLTGKNGAMPKSSDGYVSVTLKGGDSKVVNVSILISLMALPRSGQRVGAIVAFERKNQDVVKKVYCRATTVQRAMFKDPPAGAALDSFGLKLRTVLSESPLHHLIPQSPLVSPESSVPTSPYGSIPLSARAQNPFTSSLPDLSLSLPPLDNPTIVGLEAASTTLPHRLTSSSQASEAGWGLKQFLSDWSKDREEGVSDDVSEGVVVDESESSRSESGSGRFGSDPLFKIEMLPSSQNQSMEMGQQKEGNHDRMIDLSSAAALTRSLASHDISEPGRALFAGELILDDTSDQDRREASFLLKSESLQDIWIQFHLAWEGTPELVELWVNTLSEPGAHLHEGGNLSQLSARRSSKQLQWEQPEQLEYSQTESTVCMSSAFLKGNSKLAVTLIYRDECTWENSAVGTVPAGVSVTAYHNKYLQGTGVLTIQARPDDGLSHQLLIRLKKLDRCIRVSPSNITFPESELKTVLQQDVIIQNRISTSVRFTTNVTETILGDLMGSSRIIKGNFSDKLPERTELSLPVSNEIPNGANDPVIISVNPASGDLEAHASTKIKVSCRPLNHGTKSRTLHVQGSLCLEETKIGITLIPKRGHWIHLPDLPDGVTLDMGFCFINSPSVEKVVPLRIQNFAKDPVLLTFRSNLAKQVYMCSTSNGSRRTDDLQMSGGDISTVFMCMRPGGDVTAFEGGQCREIIGGMRITAHAISAGTAIEPGRGSNGEKAVDEVMVKFHAVVGRSLLQVSSSMIDLGRVNRIGGFVAGHFWVSNPSSQMPLHFSLQSERAQLSIGDGHLDGKDTVKPKGIPVVSEMTVKFSLPANVFGLVEDKIIVRNLFCTGQIAEVVVRLFVNSGVVEGCPELLLPHFQREEVKQTASLLGPTLDLPPRGSKSGRTNYRSSHLKTPKQVPSLGSSLEGETANVIDRKIRKASSAGECFFAELAVPLKTKDVAVLQQENVDLSEVQETAPFVSNSFLHLGTVFVSPDNRTQATQSIDEPGNGDALQYLISDLRPYHCSVLIINLLQEAIVLQPFSNLQMHVAVEGKSLTPHLAQKEGLPSPGTVEEDSSLVPLSNQDNTGVDPEMEAYRCLLSNGRAHESLSTDIGFGLVTKLSSCGRPFRIQPSSTARLLVTYLDVEQLSSFDSACLATGKVCDIEGLLVFVKCKSSAGNDNTVGLPDRYYETEDAKYIQIGCQAVEVFNIRGSICVSWGKLAKSYVQLGKVGQANRWADVEFEFTVENISDSILVYQLVDVPECFSIAPDGIQDKMDVSDRRGCVAPKKFSTLKGTLCTSKLEHAKQAGGPCSWRISLLNCNNPGNMMQLFVAAEMTVRNLRFEGLTEGILLVPPLTVPRLQNAPPCSIHFMVENLSREPLVVALQLQQTEETESLITLEVVSKTNAAIGEFTLDPRGKVELRICASPISDIIPSTLLAQHTSLKSSSSVDSAKESIGKEKNGIAADEVDSIRTNTEAVQVEDAEHTVSKLGSKKSIGDFRELSQQISKLCLGQLYLFSSPHSPDCIPIHGVLLQGSSFDVSPHSLHFQPTVMLKEDSLREAWMDRHDKAGCSQIVVIRNFRAFEPLQFKVFPTEFEENVIAGLSSDSLLVQPMRGSIPPGESAEILVGALPWSRDDYQTLMDNWASRGVGHEPLTCTLNVQDSESQESEKYTQRILVSIQPPSNVQEPVFEGLQATPKPLSRNLGLDRTAPNAVLQSAQSYNRRPIVLGLLGCTPVEGNLLCYEFNLGQQNISSGGRLHWDLTLVGDQHSPVNYKLSTIGEGYANWLTISNSSGVVDAEEQKIVRLSFSTKAMGVYSTYLVLENFENPSDFKTVHVSLEVVALRNTRPEASSLRYFHVQVDGGRAEGTVIDMGEVYYNFWYRNRSFVVVNDAQVAMEFLLSSTLDENDSTELNFSLANTSLKRFSSVTLGSKSSIRIWIHFCPGPSKDKAITEDTDLMSEFIFINCRLVKDYRQCIPFRAQCRCPQIGISTTDIVFSTRRRGQAVVSNLGQEDSNLTIGGKDSENCLVNPPLIENEAAVGRSGMPVQLATGGESDGDGPREARKPNSGLSSIIREDDMELLPEQYTLIIRNLFAHRTLQYVVKNDSLFFTADVPETQIVSSSSRTLEGKELISQSRGPSQSFHAIIVKPNMKTLLNHQKSVLKQKYTEEHLTVYNRSNPREKYTVSLRITAGHLRNFFADPGSKNSHPFSRLEVQITGFLSHFHALASHVQYNLSPLRFETEEQPQVFKDTSKERGFGLERPLKHGGLASHNEAKFQALERLMGSWICDHVSDDYDSLIFEFYYLTDELVYYGLKERWSRGGATLELATVQLAKLLYCALYRCQIFQLCLACCQFHASATSSLAQEDNSTADAEEGPVPYSTSSATVPSGLARLDQPSTKGPSETLDNASGFVSPPESCLRFLENWTGQLRHFLSYFPDSRDDLIPLRELSQENQVSIEACRAAFDRNQPLFPLQMRDESS